MYLMCDDEGNDRPTNITQMNDVYYQIPPTPCAGCQLSITDRYYLLVAERCWHVDCLQCCVCGTKLESEVTCFSRAGLIFCKDDYYKQFLKRCGRCNRILSPKELVMRAKEYTFHLHCFNCVVCSCRLNPGDFFGLALNGILYCQNHYEPLLYNGQIIVSPTSSSGLTNISSSGGSTKGRPKKRKIIHHDTVSSSSCLMGSADTGSISLSPNAHSVRSKRMRTSFKHHQLRTMKAYFALNHNPDAKDLKQLAQKTGLTKRVLQVWFQNARAKYRRALQLKQDGTGGETPKDAGTKDEPSTSSSTPAQGHMMTASDSSNLADSMGSGSINGDILEGGSVKTENSSSPGCHTSFRLTSSASLPSTSVMNRKSPLTEYSFGAPNLHIDCAEGDDVEDNCASTKSLADYFQNCGNNLL